MADDLRQLLVDQANTIASIKRVLINFKKLPKANVTLARTRGRLADLKELWSEVQRLNNRLCLLATAEEKKAMPYFINDNFYDAEDAYNEAADHLNETMSRLCIVQSPSCNPGRDSSFRDSHSGATLQLPRISLPKFSGNYLEWENFRNMFESLVASNDAITNTQKLHYLKSSVSGDAALLIVNLKITDANYDSAWQLLVAEYDDKQALVHAQIHFFASLPAMKTENVTELKRLRDTLSASLAALANLGHPVDRWDDILIYLIAQKFSQRTRNEWNLRRSISSSELPSYKELNAFLTLRIRGLTDLSDAPTTSLHVRNNTKTKSSVHSVSVLNSSDCSGNHSLTRCEDFLSKSIAQRSATVKLKKLCFNCLRPGHFTPTCTNKARCRHCGHAHHSLLHIVNSDASQGSVSRTPAAGVSMQSPEKEAAVGRTAAIATVQMAQARIAPAPCVLLATAWVNLHTQEGRSFKVRALLDQGSTFSFISESLCQLMKRTKRTRAEFQIRCFGEKYTGIARSRVAVSLSPYCQTEPMFPLTYAYVYQRITSYAVSLSKPIEAWSHLHNLSVADPHPASNHPIHLLIGADLYGSLLLGDLRQGPIGTPTAQSTALGWILSGPIDTGQFSHESAPIFHCVSDYDTHCLLQKFWEDEEISQQLPMTEEEKLCEEHFATTHSRTSQGRYMVRLPFKKGPPLKIGESLPIAMSLYDRAEKRLRRRQDIYVQYHDFLREYQSLGHMKLVENEDELVFPPVYIPHHAVVRETSSTTKLRVVFNASCKTRDGTSLKDHLLIGSKLQADLAAIILRWRQ